MQGVEAVPPIARAASADDARARRAWRILLVAYLVPITVLTHWPRFGVAGAGMVDKFVHFVAFGSLAWMAMQAAPRGRALPAWILAAAWVYVDEITQALEILGRTFSLEDMTAGWIGVGMAGLLHAVRARRGPSGSRAALDARMYGEPGAWLRAALVAAAVLALVGGTMFASRVVQGEPANFPTAVYPIGFGALVGLIVATAVGEWRAARRLALAPPARPWPTALGAVPIIAALLLGLFLGIERVLFGDAAPDERSVDHQGFVVLREGFLLVAVVLAFECVRMWCTRAAPPRSDGSDVATDRAEGN